MEIIVFTKSYLWFWNKRKNPCGEFPLLHGFWWAHLDSNQAPTDYESVALTE